MVKSSKANQIKRNKKIKKSVKNKRGGNASLYGLAQMAQSRGCARYQGVRNPDPTSSFDTCECIDRNNTKIDQFEFPKGVFTCSPTEGLKLVESTANPLYRTYKQLEEQVFFTKSTEFPMKVEAEFQKLLEKNKTVAQEAARFLIDYTLDSREHRDRVFYDTLVPENIQTLMNNVQAILENVALVANNPNLKFHDITKLLGKLVNKLQKQYIQLRELEKSHGKLLEQMELLGKTDGEEDQEEVSTDKLLFASTNTEKTQQISSKDDNEYVAIIAKQLAQFFGEPDLSLVKNQEREFVKVVMSMLPNLLKKYYKTTAELMEKISKKDDPHFIARKVVELIFEKDLNVVRNLSVENIIKFLRAYIGFFMKRVLKKDPRLVDEAVALYNIEFMAEFSITNPEDWVDSTVEYIKDQIKDNPEFKSKPKMYILAYGMGEYLIDRLNERML